MGFKIECYFFVTASQYLVGNMPLDAKLLKDVLFIHPLNRNDLYVANAISRLALQFIEVLGSKLLI